MDVFSQKLRLIYLKLFDEDIEKFTEYFIDQSKFDKKKFDLGSEAENRQQFFLNRKTVLRRWLNKGSSCTPDFQKSFSNYKFAQYELNGSPLFNIADFRRQDNLEAFNLKVEQYLKKQQHLYVKTDYQYIYYYCEMHKKIYYYEIVEWTKGEKQQRIIKVKENGKHYRGTFSLSDNNNIFITLSINNSTKYFLFHAMDDRSCSYTVGVNMGYLPEDNIVPRSQKVIFSKELLNVQALRLDFILNETEVLSSIENRLNLNSKIMEEKVNYFQKYAHTLKKYFNFFNQLSQKEYQKLFYYRLGFREFYSIKKLFRKISKKESYYIFDYAQAFLELLKTVQSIQNTSLQVVMKLNSENIFLQMNRQSLETKNRFLDLYSTANVKSTIIFVTKEEQILSENTHALLDEMAQNNIEVRLISEYPIANRVNSLDFSFIYANSPQDFVLADPIRDSKDVYKLFIDELTMEEYRTDYQRFLEKSKVYNAKD